MKTLIGIVTFGNLDFTKLAVRGIRETLTEPADLLVVIGKPRDIHTEAWLRFAGIPFIRHPENLGFPASINDIYDCAWNGLVSLPQSVRQPPDTPQSYQNVIIMGNDVVPYPGALDAMIRTANATDWEWICASQFDSRSLVARYPEARPFFHGDGLAFTDFSARPWEMHADFRAEEIEPNALKDVRNLTLFKRSVFEKIGYADVNFWPGGYFEDNDYCTRGLRAKVQACGLAHAAYFHFWSRTLHQGGKGAEFHEQFRRNEQFYKTKWGGGVGKEKFERPFDGHAHVLDAAVRLEADVCIGSREMERAVIAHWNEGRNLKAET